MPKPDPRTWIILALLGVLLAVVIFVPPVRLAVASALAFVASLLGASKVRQKRKASGEEPAPEPTPSDEIDQEIDEQTTEEQTATGGDLADKLNEQTDAYVD